MRESRDERAPSAMWEAPAWAKEVAISRPMPRDAPTTKMLLFRGEGMERDEIAGKCRCGLGLSHHSRLILFNFPLRSSVNRRMYLGLRAYLVFPVVVA